MMRRRTQERLVQSVAPALLVVAILLGGASAAGYPANALLQLAAIPLILIGLTGHYDRPASQATRQLLALAVALLAIFSLQLVPLPPGLWSALPGRSHVVDGFEMLGLALPWLPISLNPRGTLGSLLWLLPAFSMLLVVARAGAYRAAWLAWTLAALAAVSIVLGALQLAGGTGSPAYLYRITNYGQAVGFFSNANHFATLLLTAIPFMAALARRTLDDRRSRQRTSAQIAALAALAITIGVGLVISGSLAGIGIAVPVAVASAFLIRGPRGLPRWAVAALTVLGLAAAALAFSAPFGNNLTSAEARDDSLSRYTSFSHTLEASTDYLPVGSGIGSFVDAYRLTEAPADVGNTYMNHAHSDPLEILLETGVAGVLLIVLLLLWWTRRTIAIWRAATVDAYARAATIATGAIMAHSLVDYPLRTAAMATIFALGLALMAEPRERTLARGRESSAPGTRHLVA